MAEWYRKENGEIDREKVIDELERDLVREPDEQSHIIGTFDREAVGYALELLKAQEARLLTKEEIISWEGYIWKEFKGMTAMKALLIDHGMEREPYIGDFPTNSYLWDNYNQYWRCWTSRPTEEQRKAVKWE